MENLSVDVILPVYRPSEEFRTLLWMLKKQTVSIGKYILFITESPGTVYPDFGSFGNVETHFLKPEDFDHGGTRNLAAACSEADYLLFMTQDAEPVNNYLVENLLKTFEDPAVAVAYGRQVPRQDCSLSERFTRQFNYPPVSRVKSEQDIPELGIKTFFCSDVCAMYDRRRFLQLGGFPFPAIFNEDMIFASKAIYGGYRVAYAAEAEVRHSHNLTGMQQLRRNFDLAVSQTDHPEVFSGISSEKEGIALLKSTVRYLGKSGAVFSIFHFLYQCGMKYIGYRLGKSYRKHSAKFNRFFSTNKYYWEKYYGTDQSNKM